MAALFALGVMSLGWMAFIAALIAIEKLAAVEGARQPRDRGRCCSSSALAVAFAPASVPGPHRAGSAEAMQGMDGGSMGGGMDDGSMSGGWMTNRWTAA